MSHAAQARENSEVARAGTPAKRSGSPDPWHYRLASAERQVSVRRRSPRTARRAATPNASAARSGQCADELRSPLVDIILKDLFAQTAHATPSLAALHGERAVNRFANTVNVVGIHDECVDELIRRA